MTDTLPAPTALPFPQRIKTRDSVALLGIGTANPPSMSQADIAAQSETFACSSDAQRAWLRRVFLRCGVEARGSVLKTGEGMDAVREFYRAPTASEDRGPSTAARMTRYAREAPPLAYRAAAGALADAGLSPGTITHLITTSCTGFFAPGLDVALIRRLALSPMVRRLHVGFMGCHAAFNALGAARDAVRADPAARVLVCSVELSTLHFAYGFDPQKLIANALFADGASACVVGAATRACAAGGSWRVVDSASLLIPDSQAAMTWHIGDHGFEMSLSPDLPARIRAHLRPWCEQVLAEHNLTLADMRNWAIHPGGPKILTAAAEALGLPEAVLHASHAVLARHGNMSSATLLFLLAELGRSGGPGPTMAIGFGPGLMTEVLLLDRG